MAKKNWIYIKRGLSEDPKHRAAMGECVWLYMHIIDRADWETGTAFDWKDNQEAADMSLPVDTLRRQRQKLDGLDYIRCNQKQHSQDIRIMEWKNPRDYSAEIKNPRVEGSHEALPSNSQGLNQGSNEGLNQGQAQVATPSSDSKSKPKSIKTSAEKKPAKPPTPPEVLLFREVTERYPQKINYSDVTAIIQGVSKRLGRACTTDDLRPFFAAWCANGWNRLNLAWLSYAERNEIPTAQKGNSYGKNQQVPTSNTQYTDEDRRIAADIRAKRAAAMF